jgi:hypothetical protein
MQQLIGQYAIPATHCDFNLFLDILLDPVQVVFNPAQNHKKFTLNNLL